MQGSKPFYIFLSRRESQILDIIYSQGEASASDVLKHLPDPPGYNCVRRILTILESMGYLRHEKKGQKRIYIPKLLRATRKLAMKHLLSTFFENSPSKAVTALLNMSASKLSERELEDLSKTIERIKLNKKKRFHYKIQAIT